MVAPLVAIVVGLFAIGLRADISALETPSSVTGRTPAEVAAPASLLRQGTELDNVIGEFQSTGDRILFQPRDREAGWLVLENLALERVARAVEEIRQPGLWSVSGTLTEFRGANFLLISRAVLRAGQPAADQRSQPAGR
jgi:hypothetical protein